MSLKIMFKEVNVPNEIEYTALEDKPMEELYPKTMFHKYDHVLYEDEQGKFQLIGHTNYDSISLIATKFVGEMANEWKANSEDFYLMDVKAEKSMKDN